jgi:hypothetical protein
MGSPAFRLRGNQSRLRDRAVRGVVRAAQSTENALLATLRGAGSAGAEPATEGSGAPQSQTSSTAETPGSQRATDLQEHLLRFEGRFSARLMGAFRPLIQAARPDLQAQAMVDELAYLSSALEIAVGPSPELDLLDMVTLVALGRDAMGSYWRAHAPPDLARGIETAFDEALDDIRKIARSVLTADLENAMFDFIREWRRDHRDERDVVIVRLSQYVDTYRGSAGLQPQFSGVLARIRGLTTTADSALLLGRRALFAAQRLPFLLRMHLEIATADILLTVRHTVADATRESLPSVQQTATDVSNRTLVKIVLAGSAIAIVASTGWLVARLAYHWLGGS